MQHRGPDDAGVVEEAVGRRILLGHRRLSIIDLSSLGHQPMYDATNNYCIVYNGEVYNFQELRQELESAGFRFRSRSDTEVVLYAYIAWGEEFVERLDGIFALAILDKPRKRLVLARDRVGTKPLYYALSPDFVFASEIKPILQILPQKPALRYDLLHEYFALNWIMEPDTIFEGIHKVPSGSILTYDLADGVATIRPYWSPEMSLQKDGGRLDLDVLEDKLERSVSGQLISDIPLGVYLSGGIDSSLVAYYSGKAGQDSLNTLTASFGSGDLRASGVADDSYYAGRLVEDLPKLSGHLVKLDVQGLHEYERLISHIEEPVSDSAVVPAFLLARAAKEKGITVMLSGMGGDELFGGYRRYRLTRLPRTLGALLSSLLLPLSGGPRRRPKLRRDLQRARGFFRGELPASYVHLVGYFAEHEISRFVGGEGWRSRFSDKLSKVCSLDGLGAFRKMQLLDFVGFLSSHNLLYVDKASMAASVEVRVPLLSNRLLDYVLQLRAEELATIFELKRPLRALAAKRLPSYIVRRPKAGFLMPINAWFRQEPVLCRLREVVHDTRLSHLVGEKTIRTYISWHLDNTIDTSMKLFNLYTLACWAATFGYTFS